MLLFPGFESRPDRGPVCFDCDTQGNVDDCDMIVVCGRDEVMNGWLKQYGPLLYVVSKVI